MTRFLAASLIIAMMSPAFADPTIVGVSPNVVASQGATGTQAAGWWTNPDVTAVNQSLNSASLNAVVTTTVNNGQGVVSFVVSGLTASAATLTAEGTSDGGSSWYSINTIKEPATGAISTTLTTDGTYSVRSGGRTSVRLRVSTIGAGSIVVAYDAASVASLIGLSAPIPPPGPFAPANTGCFPGLTAVSCLTSANLATVKHLYIQNIALPALGASVACSFTSTAAIYLRPSFILTTGASREWGPNTFGIPAGTMSCITDHVPVVTATIHSGGGGTGYGNTQTCTVTVVGGTGTAAVLNITTNSSGVVTSTSISSGGNYTVTPGASAVATTGPTAPCSAGTGFTTDLTLNIPFHTEQW